jgi:hypothetical protein
MSNKKTNTAMRDIVFSDGRHSQIISYQLGRSAYLIHFDSIVALWKLFRNETSDAVWNSEHVIKRTELRECHLAEHSTISHQPPQPFLPYFVTRSKPGITTWSRAFCHVMYFCCTVTSPTTRRYAVSLPIHCTSSRKSHRRFCWK